MRDMADAYRRIAVALRAAEGARGNERFGKEEEYRDEVKRIVRDEFPSGSGFDSGTRFDFERSRPDRLVFFVEYHHMDHNGFYSGWTEHRVTVRPSFAFGFEVKVGGRDVNNIKGYIAELFS